MSTIVTLDQPRARIVYGCRGHVAVHGWHKVLLTDRGVVLMSALVSIHSFRWTARWAMRRWLKRQTQVSRFSGSIPT